MEALQVTEVAPMLVEGRGRTRDSVVGRLGHLDRTVHEVLELDMPWGTVEGITGADPASERLRFWIATDRGDGATPSLLLECSIPDSPRRPA